MKVISPPPPPTPLKNTEGYVPYEVSRGNGFVVTLALWPEIGIEGSRQSLQDYESTDEPMSRTDLPPAVWQHLVVDLLGPLPSGDYIFVVVDYYGRFFVMEFTKSTTAQKIVSLMSKMSVTHSLPCSLKGWGGGGMTTKPLPRETSYGTFSRPFNSTIVLFGQLCTPLLEITTTFRESPDQNRKSLKTQRVYPSVL